MISVIVPIYNSEKYLVCCINSLINQTYADLEIILIDDGSTDSSGKICDYWKDKDNRIKVFHLENGGAARARNIGIKEAHGEFIGFVDSDDYIHPHMYEYLLRIMHANNCDLVECGYEMIEEEYKFENRVLTNDLVSINDSISAMKLHIEDKKYCQIVWNKLYRREVMVPFVEDKMIDDEFWTYRVIGKIKKAASLSEKLYYYRQQQGSIMHQKYTVKRLQVLEARNNRLKYLEKYFPELVIDAKVNLYFSCIYHGQMIIKFLTGNEKKEGINKINYYRKKNNFSEIGIIKNLSLKQQLWFLLSKINFWIVCKIRNYFNYGF